VITCIRGECGGTVDDGFCTVCGLAPAGSDAGTPATVAQPATSAQSGTMPWRSASIRGSRRGTSSTSRRGQLGIGLVEVPRVPYRDPTTAVLTDPEVAVSKRYCSRCGVAVGRGQDGQPGRTEGFCTQCGTHFSFTPKLVKGDVVAGQYEVLGCLAHGGLGWIYLARDRNVSDRWVVLKGLLDTGDADAMAAALAERRFLAEVEHPNIVRIYNFVQHYNERSRSNVGYIVMEYVGGASLRDMLRARRRTDPAAALPLPQVIAYGIEALRALGYLHSLGLVYCDFKPDNVIQTEEQVKLIDLGAARRADDDEGSVWGTIGYQAPEVAVEGPSVASDIYTVGRALAVLSFPFDFTKRYVDRLPDAAEVPVLAEHPSFHRLLLRATDPDPDRRFASAEEMGVQLAGVLREVLAASDGRQRPGASTLFTPERRTFGVALARDPSTMDVTAPPSPEVLIAALPVPQVDTSDPAAGLLTTLTESEPAELIAALDSVPERTVEVRLRLARAHLELGDPTAAHAVLMALAKDEPGDWRIDYYGGLTALAALAKSVAPSEAANPGAANVAATARLEAARARFDEVYGVLPGEAAPKLALAACAELTGDLPLAARYYESVWRTDHSFVSAAFGLARVRMRQADRAGAIDVLESVPVTSSQHVAAQITAVLARTQGEPTEDELLRAGVCLGVMDIDAERASYLTIEVLTAALTRIQSRRLPEDGRNRRLLGSGLTERELRLGLERHYRALARLASRLDDRIALVDRANAIRPRTLV
jgi:serine/threonine-protein kinase PknG